MLLTTSMALNAISIDEILDGLMMCLCLTRFGSQNEAKGEYLEKLANHVHCVGAKLSCIREDG